MTTSRSFTRPPLPGRFANTGELLAAAARAHGDRDAYVEQDGTRISFAQWYRHARGLATHLRARGIAQGDVVALMLPSTIDYAVCYAAAALVGAVTTGINPRLGPRETHSILAQAAPALVIRDSDAGLPEVDPGIAVLTRAELATCYSSNDDNFVAAEMDSHDPVTIIFTSGTTGMPKGAWFDAANLAASAAASGVMSAPYDRRLSSTPFSHAGYMAKLWDQLIWGSTVVISPVPWSAAQMRDILIGERITMAGGVPTQWAKLLDLPNLERNSFPDLRLGVVATAPAAPELIERTAQLIGVPLVVRYAMTESPTVCGTDIGDPPEVAFRTVGKPQSGMHVRVTDDDGTPLPVGRIGRVRVRGGCVMRGYWNNPAVTRDVFDDEGYFISGDLGSFTAEGNLTLAGRTGDMYIRGGFNVHPVEVENVLAEHPAVNAVAVVGHPMPVIGEIGVAFVVANDDAPPPTLAELRAWAKERLGDYKAPDHMVVIDAIPLTAMSKIDRTKLRELAVTHPPAAR
ncbi:class I adenylate-forming enzyme family protein [Nocardia miyunensis]|uniref:class I adenylate-forming enzyme family protein n=1 Tax=Nocardia miyunensis TaxID=282684 RepID=UPI00082E6307|nr:class I adenylate-forming enzyme family protein [Nocardia miyunensis]